MLFLPLSPLPVQQRCAFPLGLLLRLDTRAPAATASQAPSFTVQQGKARFTILNNAESSGGVLGDWVIPKNQGNIGEALAEPQEGK